MRSSSTPTGSGSISGAVLAASGHWVAEQAPEQLLGALSEFLGPNRVPPPHGRGRAPMPESTTAQIEES